MMNNIELDEPPDYFRCIKLPLRHILKNPDLNLPKINDAVTKCNKIVINTFMFMKLYLLCCFEKDNKLPVIDKNLVFNVMKILCIKKNNSGCKPSEETQKLKNTLSKFYEKHYKPLIIDIDLNYEYMANVLHYLSINIVTIYETNIKLHYIEYIERFINVIFKKKETIDNLKNNKKYEDIKEFESQLNNIISDILSISNSKKYFKSDKKYHIWIKEHKKLITPYKNNYKMNSMHYDLTCHPQDYLPCMIRMMEILEKKDVKIYNIFPMRTSTIPNCIKLDTITLVHLLFTEKQGLKKNYRINGDMKKNEDKIWKFFFRTERKCFNNSNYTFHHMMETDGISCSIIFLKNDLIGKKLPTVKPLKHKNLYIDEITNFSNIKNKKIVGIDPGLSDLIYCVDDDNKNANKFRYTQNSRRKECKIKKYSKIILNFRKEKIKNSRSDKEKTVIELETKLSELNRKTLDIKKFTKYIKLKSKINHLVFDFYQQNIFRKLRLNGYINRKKHEQNMINKFKKIFGSPEKTIICIGDYESKKHIKYIEPVKSKGIKILFKKAGYQLFLVNEFRTSIMCSKCQKEEGKCEKFQMRKNPKPFREGAYLAHGVLRCKNCKTVWNRDVNGATNICRIAKQAIQGKSRPEYLSRKNMTIDDVYSKSVKLLELKKRIYKLSKMINKLQLQLRSTP